MKRSSREFLAITGRISAATLAMTLVVQPLGGLVLASPPADAPAPAETPPAEPAAAETEGAEQPAAETEGAEPAAETEGAEPAETEGAEPASETDGEGETEGADEAVPPEPAEPAGPERPDEPRWGPKKQYKMKGTGMLITGGVTLGLGVAFIITSVLVTTCDHESALACEYGDQRKFLVPTAVAMTAVGAMVLGVGFGLRSKYKKWQKWTPEGAEKAKAMLAPTFDGRGGGIAVTGRF